MMEDWILVIIAGLVILIAGFLCHTFGRREPFIAIGTILEIIGAVVMVIGILLFLLVLV